MVDAFAGHEHVGEIRNIGLINAIEFVQDKNGNVPYDTTLRTGYQVYKKALELGLILRPIGDVVYFNPPLNITKSEIDEAIDLCKKAVCGVLR